MSNSIAMHVLVINDISKMVLFFHMVSCVVVHLCTCSSTSGCKPMSNQNIFLISLKDRPLIRRFRVPSYAILRRSNIYGAS